MALEDEISLGTLLGSLNESTHTRSIEQRNKYIRELLQLFESQRKPRTSLQQRGTLSNQYWYQVSTPEEMEWRDKVLKTADGQSPFEWKGCDPEYQTTLLGFHAKAAAVEGHPCLG
jgi:NDP-sugar pyrophosphorylase family protein